MIKKLSIFEISEDYLKYLHSFDKSIHLVTGALYVNTTKYIGPFENKVLTFAPLSSDKNKLHINDFNNINFMPMRNQNKYYGVIRICNQIPILDSKLIKEVNFTNEFKCNKKYSHLLLNEYRFINTYKNCTELILKSHHCSLNKKFDLLIEASKLFDLNNQLVIERIKAYPKVFSKQENNLFFKKVKINKI
jgi:hypothetical protein